MATIDPYAVDPEEAIKWFREKGYRIGYDWRDTWNEEHAWAFTVAKAMQLDLLADLREAVDEALSQGRSFGEFKKGLKPILQQRGWWGEKEEVDPLTGEVKTVQLGSTRRLRIIYDTNLRQAHNAGQWQRAQRLKATRPYLRYIVRKGGANRRPEHQAWRDTVLPVDDPWWDTHHPANGFGCECGVQQLNARDVKRLGLHVTEQAPPIEHVSWENPRTGAVERVPKGISPGFGYNPGRFRGGAQPPPGQPPSTISPLSPVNTYADYDRPKLRDLPDSARRPAPAAFPSKKDVGAQAVRERFRTLFGVPGPRDAGYVRDVTGVMVRVDDRLVRYVLRKPGYRERYLPHAKAAIEDPYEIWLVPHRRKDGSVALRKRYIGVFRGNDSDGGMLVVVEDDLAFNAYPRGNDTAREGYLLYQRP